jgi:RecB family exonuclease
MSTFIDRVADVFLEKHHSGIQSEVIFPTRRAALYLNQAVAKRIDRPMWTPESTTLDQWVKREMKTQFLDPLEGLFELHRLFDFVSEEDIGFDRFSKWGRMMLNDFSEIDRYLVDPKAFFSHLEAHKKLDEWMENSFHQDDKLPTAFIEFWRDMGKTYFLFREWCEENNRYPQGMAFRILIENLDDYIERWTDGNRHFILAGFNAVSKSEEKLFRTLMDHKLADILWDYDAYYLENNIHEAGLFGRQIQKWPQYSRREFDENVSRSFQNSEKQITLHAVSGNVAQAKYATQLIHEVDSPNHTALILADESLLVPVLMNLPSHLDKVNVTMGYPVSHSATSQFIQQWMNLLVGSNHVTRQGAKTRVYYHQHVREILNSPILKYAGLPTEAIHRMMAKKNRMVVSNDFLKSLVEPAQAKLIDLLFWKEAEIGIAKWLEAAKEFIQLVRANYRDWQNQNFWSTELEFLYQHWTFINRFEDLIAKYDSQLTDFGVFRKFYHQQAMSETTDFFGEPLSGLQVMGLLEARALDFKHIIITSMNEGSLPKNSKNNSLIPYEIKRAYDLPTFTERDAIFAHHFYRAITRAEKVDLIYNSSEGQNVSELSRFVHQLKFEWKGNFSEKWIKTPEAVLERDEFEIPKTKWVMERLEKWAQNPEKGISVSAIQTYMLNPLEFYNRYILGIGEESEVEEDIEGKTIGDIVHNTLENIYSDYENEILTADILLKVKKKYPKVMDEEFGKKEYHPGKLEGKNYLIYEVSKQYVKNQIRKDLEEVKNHELIYHQGEKELRSPFKLSDGAVYYLQGKVDRIDSVEGMPRILDYKTGSVQLNKSISSELFSNLRTKFEIQLLWYAHLYLHERPELSVEDIEIGLISLRENAELKRTKITTEDLMRFREQLGEILQEIMNPDIPFRLDREAKFFNTVGQ